MEHVINKPSNPYVGPMRVFPGTMLRITGRPSYSVDRFAINLQIGPNLSPRDDIALHFCPSFGSPSKVIRNSLIDNRWGQEESDGYFAFSPNTYFEVLILVNEAEFMIAINSAHYCVFKHRVDYQDITHLTIDGDVEIDRIGVVDMNQQQQQQANRDQQDAVYVPRDGFQTATGQPIPGPMPSMSTGRYGEYLPPLPSVYPAIPWSFQPAVPTPGPRTSMPHARHHHYPHHRHQPPQPPPTMGPQPSQPYYRY